LTQPARSLAPGDGQRASKPPAPALYQRFASWYDTLYDHGLQPGRDRALERLRLADGEDVLELGVGTGLSAVRYPTGCRVVAIDLSAEMLARAGARLRANSASHVRLCRMDGLKLAFADAQFDAVYAPYFINTVPDPVAVASEMVRVCRPGGRIVFLNHFRAPMPSVIDRLIGEVATRLTGVQWSLDLETFLAALPVVVLSIDQVNLARVSSVVLCRKPHPGV
jgi:phosphatidylethanolamine/phosphatidyl-N-methylethanolamine N-methyltransferase